MPIKEKFYIREGLVVNGDTIITGSVTTSVGFTGSLEGTASYSTTAQTLVGSVTSASFASTASFVNSLKQNVTVTGSLVVSGSGATIEVYGDKLIVGTVGGDEGGEILLGKPVTNNSLTGSGVTIDSYRNFIRFFEQGGSARGAYIDLTACAGGVGTNLLSGGGGSGTVNSGTANKLTYYASTGTAVSEASLLEYNGSNLKLTSTSQLEFYTNAGSIYFGNFSSPSYGRVGFSVPGQSVMVIDYSNVRAGFGGGTSLITSAPGGLVEIQGKADEVQLLVTANSSQTNDIAQFKNSSGATTVKVDSAGTLVSTLQVLPTSSPTSPVNGSVYWDGNSATLFIYDGSNWKSVQLM